MITKSVCSFVMCLTFDIVLIRETKMITLVVTYSAVCLVFDIVVMLYVYFILVRRMVLVNAISAITDSRHHKEIGTIVARVVYVSVLTHGGSRSRTPAFIVFWLENNRAIVTVVGSRHQAIIVIIKDVVVVLFVVV